LPLARMSTAVGKYWGSQVDKCLEVETDIIISLAGGNSILVIILVDIAKPL
ncbi:hypothetical protein TorRG33x02_245520, partial [Trema orientale]